MIDILTWNSHILCHLGGSLVCIFNFKGVFGRNQVCMTPYYQLVTPQSSYYQKKKRETPQSSFQLCDHGSHSITPYYH